MQGSFSDQFSQGFNSQGNSDSTLLWVVVILLAAALVWFIAAQNRRARQNQKASPSSTESGTVERTVSRPIPIPSLINPLQQKIIYEMIDEFRKQEPSAQAVPAAVMEKYSEFFFQNVKKMRTRPSEVKDFVSKSYAIKPGSSVEMDFTTEGTLHLVKSRVTDVSTKSVYVGFTGPLPSFIKKGAPLLFNYSVGRHFLQGSSWISEIRPKEGLVLRRPEQVVVTSERRYSRVTLQKVSGILSDPRSGYRIPVKVLDLSPEGVRILVEKPLEKNHTYQLIFEAEAAAKLWAFGPLECLLSKAFTTGAGGYESGLIFLYLDSSTRVKMANFMKHFAQEV